MPSCSRAGRSLAALLPDSVAPEQLARESLGLEAAGNTPISPAARAATLTPSGSSAPRPVRVGRLAHRSGAPQAETGATSRLVDAGRRSAPGSTRLTAMCLEALDEAVQTSARPDDRARRRHRLRRSSPSRRLMMGVPRAHGDRYRRRGAARSPRRTRASTRSARRTAARRAAGPRPRRGAWPLVLANVLPRPADRDGARRSCGASATTANWSSRESRRLARTGRRSRLPPPRNAARCARSAASGLGRARPAGLLVSRAGRRVGGRRVGRLVRIVVTRRDCNRG